MSGTSSGSGAVTHHEPPPLAAIAGLPSYPWIVVGLTCIGAFIGQLDASIVQLALPELERAFDAGLGAVTWVAIAYLVAFAASLPVFARLSEIYGRKLLYLIGYAGFAIASALCGIASSLGWLIAFRVLQGAFGSLLGANSITILLAAAGQERRGRAMGIFAAAQAIGVSCGPAVGGLLLGSLGWQSIFWASVPFAVVAAVAGWFIMPQTTSFSGNRVFDWGGALLLTPALSVLMLVLSEIHAWGPTSAPILIAFAAAVLLLVAFVRREMRVPAPLVELRLFRDAGFTCGIVAVLLSYALLYGIFFLMSFVFVRGFLDAPMAAGLRLAIVPVAIGLVAPISGALYERVGPRLLGGCGMLLCLAGLWLLWIGLEDGKAGIVPVMVALALYGAGLGLFIAPNNTATAAAAPAEHAGKAGGLINLMRVLGTSTGVAVGASALSWRLAALAGTVGRTTGVPHEMLFQAGAQVLPFLAAFAVIAGIAAVAAGPAPVAKKAG